MILNHLMIYLLLLITILLLSCDGNLSRSNAPKISLSSNQILFTAPELGNNESQFVLTVSNVGTADLIIVRTEINDQQQGDSEFSLLDQDDWNNRLVLQSGRTKDLTLIWKPLDTNQDSALLEIESNDGLIKVAISTVDLDPNINVTTINPSITKEGNQEMLIFSEAMYLGYQKAIVEVRSDSSIPLTLQEICLLNDQGDCKISYPTSDAFFLCDTAEAILSSCQPLPQELASLSFDETYRFSLFFQVIDQRDSGFYGKLRIKSNASQKPDYLIQLKGEACLRDPLNPMCQKCGDGIINDDEECDDGNLIDLDGCGLNCKHSEIACIEGKAGCPCSSTDLVCEAGLTCDSLLNLCVSCNGQIGCPCPCGPQAVCNQELGICETQGMLRDDMGWQGDLGLFDLGTLDMAQGVDMGIDEDMAVPTDLAFNDMAVSIDLALSTDLGLLDMYIDQEILSDFSLDMMIEILKPQVFHPSSLVLGAMIHQNQQYRLNSIISIGSSVGSTQQHILRATLNP
jgi:cysteine-rich repeat protein